jgi:hypothetical protein
MIHDLMTGDHMHSILGGPVSQWPISELKDEKNSLRRYRIIDSCHSYQDRGWESIYSPGRNPSN